MRIESHERYVDVADFDPCTGRLQETNRDAAANGQPISGHYARLAETLAVLYRHEGALWLRLGAVSQCLDEEGVAVRWSAHLGFSRLSVSKGDHVRAEVEYANMLHESEGDPTPFAESEDWDFGLFVHNVLTSPERRRRIYSTNASD